jgi:molybdate transport system substrate-binding protein
VIRGLCREASGQSPIEDFLRSLQNTVRDRGRVMRIAFVFAAAVLFVSSSASAVDIAMLATGATKEIVLELIPKFEKSTGHKVVATWTGTAGIRKRIGDGEIHDLVIVGAPVIDSFIAQGKVVPGSRTELMKSGVGVAVRAGASKPDIGSSEAVKTMLLAAKSIGYSTGPSGDHVVSLIERFGISDQIRPKLKQVPTGGRMETIITTGEAEIGFQQISELIRAPGVDYVGPLPPEIQKITVYSAGIHANAKQPEAAKALVNALAAGDAAPVIKHHGMEPP